MDQEYTDSGKARIWTLVTVAPKARILTFMLFCLQNYSLSYLEVFAKSFHKRQVQSVDL